MRGRLLTLLAVVVITAPIAAQTEGERRAETAALVEARLRASLPLELSADTITLTGNVVRLVGHARVTFDDTWISAEEMSLNQMTGQVAITGNLFVHLGRALTPKDLPRIQFR